MAQENVEIVREAYRLKALEAAGLAEYWAGLVRRSVSGLEYQRDDRR